MVFKDIKFMDFFKIFLVIYSFIFLLGAIIFLYVYTFNPTAIIINEPKLFGMLTLKLTGNYNSPLILFLIGAIDVFGKSCLYSALAVLLGKFTPLGRLKIGKPVSIEQTFD